MKNVGTTPCTVELPAIARPMPAVKSAGRGEWAGAVMGEVAKVVAQKRPITFKDKTLVVDIEALKAAFGSDSQDFVVGLVR